VAPAPKPAPKGGILNKKIAGLPGVVVVGGVVVLVGGYVWYRKRQSAASAAAAAAASPASNAATGAASTAYGPAGGAGIDPGTLQAILSSQGSGQTVAASGPSSALTLAPGQQASAGGFTDYSDTPVTDTAGNYYVPFASGQAAGQYLNSGQAAYVESAPGIFSPVTRQTISQFPGAFFYQKVPTATASTT
jgi:uncharacterized membrane protein YfcA